MIDLALSGLPLQWDELNRKLEFGPGLDKVEPALRTLQEMGDVLYGGETGLEQGEDPETPLYYMYRDIHLSEHFYLFREEGIRYDVTVLVPGTVGKEYVKTAGHYHPFKRGTGCTYPEVYEVIQGKAHYLLQKPRKFDNASAGLEEMILVAANPGDKVLIPPGFGHVTINPGPDFLVMSNLVADNFDSIYDPLREMGGAGYFEIAPGDEKQEPFFEPNRRYPSLPPLCITRPVEYPDFYLLKEKPQYRAFVQHSQNFAFLTSPEDFEGNFSDYLRILRS